MKTEHEYINEDLRPLAVPIDTLIHDPKNARKHSQRNIDAIKVSLSEDGQHSTILVWAQTEEQGGARVIMAGNGTIEAARALGWTHIAANVKPYASEKHAIAAAIRDNRTAELAEWDYIALPELLTEFNDEEFQNTLGWTNKEISELLDIAAAATGSIDTAKVFAQAGKKSLEIDPDAIVLEHQCPKCGFEFDE